MFNENNEKLILKLPFGFRDIFPVEAGERKKIEEIVRSEFVRWGYGEVKTPIVEFTENISSGIGKKWKDKLISFFDIDGNLISMRADMTIPIARLAGMRVKKGQLPARFYYFANSFRQSPAQKGAKRVLNQAGLEFIGAASVYSDVEVLTILINILKHLGIKDFKIAMGHVSFIDGICQWFKLDIKETLFVKENVILNNLLSVREFLVKKDKAKSEIFFSIIRPSENLNPVLKSASMIKEEKVAESLKYLKKIYKLLKELDFEQNIIIDLSVLRDFDYYSGLIFEIYCPEVTELIGSGGRYDGLIKKFGLDVPATGFALDVDLLHKSLGKSKSFKNMRQKKIILSGKNDSFARIIKFSDALRRKGNIVQLDFEKNCGISRIPGVARADLLYEIDFDKGVVAVTDAGTNKKQLKNIDDF